MSIQESTTEGIAEEQQTIGQLQCSIMSPSEMVAWTLVSILTVLFTGLLSVNMIVLWLYKERLEKATEGRESKYEMEGNPCYDTTAVKQTTDTRLRNSQRGGEK